MYNKKELYTEFKIQNEEYCCITIKKSVLDKFKTFKNYLKIVNRKKTR